MMGIAGAIDGFPNFLARTYFTPGPQSRARSTFQGLQARI